MKIKSLTVFCGSKPGKKPANILEAAALGEWLALNEVDLIYGGGNKGVMGAVANACLDNGGKVIGIIPKLLLEWEAQHTGLTELIITDDMHDRKKLLYEKCDAAMVLPGGIGTMDELFEMLTWNNLKIHNKKLYILNVAGYYNALIELLENFDTEEFMYQDWKEKLVVIHSTAELSSLFS
jgi:uncharacterized protein (TIGR00730 family)